MMLTLTKLSPVSFPLYSKHITALITIHKLQLCVSSEVADKHAFAPTGSTCILLSTLNSHPVSQRKLLHSKLVMDWMNQREFTTPLIVSSFD